jgi:hypothetical protein
MPEKKTIERARKARREGKSPSTQAGEFVREEIEHIREGKHGARSTEQAIAIGLSKARRAGVKLPAPEKGEASAATRKRAKRDLAVGKKPGPKKKPSAKRARASLKKLKGESRKPASTKALSKHARKAARKRTATERSSSAKKAARTRTAVERGASARKGARTRARNAAKKTGRKR